MHTRYNAFMAGEKDKKLFQFSLGRALGAITLICISLALAGYLFNGYDDSLGVAVVIIGIGSVIGVIVDGEEGAFGGVMAGFFVCVAGYILFRLFLEIQVGLSPYPVF